MYPLHVNTLAKLKADNYELTAYCEADPTVCRHRVQLDLDALMEKLGPDFVTVGDPNPLAARLRSAKCGGKKISLILSPPSKYGEAFRKW